MIRTKLAHYEITSHLGSGGMGDVYQATDSKLGRSVAIKLLPEAFSHDSERVARFEREARVLASLNHSNIAGIYGLEESAERKFLVMELVEGETLAERIKRGPIPVDEALGIAKQICEALEAAHEKGIIHRDLKPANVKITPDGKVKVLDFGLAKAFQEPQETNLSNSPTLMSAASAPGVLLGTAAYMSPEQAKGRTVDRRTDIFSFGCVLYEMLTGKRTFDGEDVSEILAHVLTAEPDWTRLPADASPRMRELLKLCLEKNPKNRRSDATDVRLDIEEALKEPGTALPIASLPQRQRFIVASVVAIVVFTLVGMGIESRLKNTGEPSTQPIQFSLSTPNGQNLPGIVSVSPDGRWLTFETTGGGRRRVWLRPIDSIEVRELVGPRGSDGSPNGLFWSPDSKQVAYIIGGKLEAIDVFTGTTRILADVPGDGKGGDGSWGQSGMILFDGATGIYKVAAGGGVPSRLDLKDGLELTLRRLAPQFLPDGEHFLYAVPKDGTKDGTMYAVPEDGTIGELSTQVGSIKSLETRPLLESESAALYVPPGYVLFVKSGTLWAQSFDSAKLSLIGDPQPLAQPIATGWVWPFFASQNGVLVFKPPVAADNSDLVWLDKNGKENGKLKKPLTGTYANPSLAPDERRVAVNSLDPRTGKSDIWIVDSTRDVAERFTLGAGSNMDPVWSPDGQQIAFFSNRESHTGLYVKSVAGAAVEQMIADVPSATPTDWSPDGRFIVYRGANRLWLLSLSDHKSTRLLPEVESLQFGARFSHDGKWIAYQSDESGRLEVYIQDFPNLTRRHQVSNTSGIHPRWGKDDTEIYYHVASRPEVDVAALRRLGTDLTPEAPRAVFDRPISVVNDGRNQYTVTADGQRFLVRQPTTSTAIPSLTVIVNWLAKLHK